MGAWRTTAFRGRVVLAGMIMLASVVMTPAAALAASSSNLTTSPISVDMKIKPGQTQTTTLQVQNNGPKALSVAVELKTFTAHGTDGQAAIVNDTAGNPSLAWVHFSQATFTAQPGVWTPIQMTVSLPASASLGYYYAVLFKPVLPTSTQKNTAKLTLSNAILVLVDTGSADENRKLTVSSFTASHKVYEYLPANLSVTIHNSGNIFLPPEGTVYISRDSSFKSAIATIDLNKSAGRVLPDSSRTFSLSWSDGFPVFQQSTVGGQPVTDKKGKPILHLHWNFSNTNHLRFGKYYARLALVYNNGQRDVPVYAVLSFWVIPWKLLLILLLVLILQAALIVGFVKYRRLYRKTRRAAKGALKE